MQFLEFYYPEVIIGIEESPSVASIVVIKFATIIIFTLILELIGLIGRAIGRATNSMTILRKMTMLDKAFKQRKKNRLSSLKKIKEVKPTISISRTFSG